MAIAAGGVVVSGLVSYFTALVKTRVDIAQVVVKLDGLITEQRQNNEARKEDFQYLRDRLDRALNGKHT